MIETDVATRVRSRYPKGVYLKQSTAKLTTAAVCTALAVIMCVMTAYLPLSFMPLYLAAFCIFSACRRSGLAYGILCALASIGLMFLMTGLSVKWLLFVVMFAPYGVIAYFMRRLTYFKVKTGIARVVAATVFFNVTFGAVYAIAVNVASVGTTGLDVVAWASRVGGYAVFAAAATAVLLPLDFIFSAMSDVVFKRLPSIGERKKPPVGSDASPQNVADGAKPEYDIFGYEIMQANENADKPDGERDNASDPLPQDGADDTE